MTTRTKLGAAGTAGWLVLAFLLALHERDTWPLTTLNEWGDFFAGVVAPLAFLWLILGYLQQGEEVRSNTDTLQRQQRALERQVEETAALARHSAEQVKVASERLELARQEAERVRAIDKARTQPVLGWVNSTGTGVSWQMTFRNSGGPGFNLQIGIDPPGGAERALRPQLKRHPLGRPPPSTHEPIVSAPSKTILGFCTVTLGAWFVLFVLLNGVAVPGGLALLEAVLLFPPVFFFLFACVLIWAVWDLVVFEDHRTWVNISV
jgi:hypothetical protein